MRRRFNFFVKSLSVVLVLFLSACQGRYASLHNTMNKCGFKQVAYSEFHVCMDESLPAPKGGEQDYYAQTAADIRSELNYCADQIASKEMKEADAYDYFTTYVNNKAIEEQKSAQVAGAFVAAGVLGAAAMSCANSGGCGSPYNSYQNHQGCCSWHGGISYVGGIKQCTGGQLVCNDGWISGCPC